MGDTNQSRRIIRFGIFEVDLRAGELRRNGSKVKLQEQPFQVLAMLLERPGEVVTREGIQQKLWPEDTFVDFEHSINAAVKRLREALGDDADNPRFVETLPRRGYRFIASADVGAGLVSAHEGRPQGAPLRRRYIVLAGAIIVATLAALLAFNVADLRDRLLRHASPPPKIESIAVLPLENLSGDPEQDYFVDGVTDALIAEIGQIGSLRVISRTSVMQYKEVKKPLPQIAKELNVDAVIEGSVLRAGDRVRITARLIGAVPERHLWARNYERDLRDVLSLQGEIARAIADEVKAKVTPDVQARLARARPVNPDAHEAYLRGRYYWSLFPEGPERAVEYFQKAAEKDPNYALAYAGLALSYNGLGFFQPPKDVCTKARAAARRALELDETLAEAHTADGFVKLYFDWDWDGAERAWRRALQLNPNNIDALQLSAEHLVFTGQFEEGLAQDRRARDLDPLSRFVNDILGYHYMRSRRYDEAIEQYRRMLELEPNATVPRIHLAWVYTLKGMHAEALAEHQKTGWRRDNPWLGYLYAKMGRRDDARRVADNVRRASTQHYVDPYWVAVPYAGVGEKDQAFAWLEKAYQDRSTFMAQLKVDAFFDPLRSDPRFQDLLHRMNFPQ